MNKHESNKMNSFVNTEEVMVRNESIWKPDEDVTKVFAAIQLKLPLVNKYHQYQKKNGNTATALKSGVKNNLVAKAVKISSSAVSYAVSKDDPALEMSVKLTKSVLNGMSQISLLDTLTLFYNKVQTLNGSLKHLEADDLDKLNQLLISFKTSIPQPGANNDETKTATQNIGESIKELNAMFKTLDKHIAPYKYTNSDFYNDYKNSRVVIDLKGKGKKNTTAQTNNQ